MNLRTLTFLLLIYTTLALPTNGQARLESVDSLRSLSTSTENDTVRMISYLQLASAYAEIDPDSAYSFASKALPIAEKLKYPLEIASSLQEMGYAMINLGNYPRALQLLLESLAISENPSNEKKLLPKRFPPADEFSRRNIDPQTQRLDRLSRTLQYAAILYINSGDADKSMGFITRSIQLATASGNLPLLAIDYAIKARVHSQAKDYDSVIASLNKGYQLAMDANYKRYIGTFLLNLGRAYAEKRDTTRALAFFREALDKSAENGYYRGIVASRLLLAELHRKNGQLDSMLYQSREALKTARTLNSPDLMIRSYRALSSYYRLTKEPDSVVQYQGLIIHLNDSLYSTKQIQQFQNIDFNESQKQRDIENAQKNYRTKVQIWILLGSILALLAIAVFIWRTSRQRQQLNKLLTRQKKDLETAIENLKKAEKQLIHAEKMASLGELTAGIAHEIQNPLNFVNNFTELNGELTDELAQSLRENNLENASTLVDHIRVNQDKVLEHGKRAESIVKSMLQHSRTGTGQQTMVQVNALLEDAVRLSYQGFKSRDKNFNAGYDMQVDAALPLLAATEQDIRRVFLNICNNAFYAVNAKSKRDGAGYQPKVIVSTKYMNGEILVVIEDNGDGIPEANLEKIFQPFFTTKPTGEGTGLGLSLGFDMVRAHGGQITVTSETGNFTRFAITLPVPT